MKQMFFMGSSFHGRNDYSFQLASSLHPQEVRPGIAVATVTGTLVSKDNRYTLEPLDLPGEDLDDARYIKILYDEITTINVFV